MDNSNFVDIRISGGNNTGNNGEDENEILIKKEELEPVNNPKCKHSNVAIDPTEELGVAYVCQDCHVGWIAAVDSPT